MPFCCSGAACDWDVASEVAADSLSGMAILFVWCMTFSYEISTNYPICLFFFVFFCVNLSGIATLFCI